MHKGLLDTHDENEMGGLAIDCQPALQTDVTNNLALATDPQGVAVPRDDKEKPDLRVNEQVFKGIQPIVAGPIRDRERLLIKDSDETTPIGAVDDVRAPEPPSAIITQTSDALLLSGTQPAASLLCGIDNRPAR